MDAYARLWPLCHVAHVRPVFRESDWEAYKSVNQRFADAVVAEARSDGPTALVQDYHFAMLQAMERKKLPQAAIITFWHIPWPFPESFGICPWRTEILQGLLGSTILGFQTRYHGKEFIETVDRYLRIAEAASAACNHPRRVQSRMACLPPWWRARADGAHPKRCREMRPPHGCGIG